MRIRIALATSFLSLTVGIQCSSQEKLLPDADKVIARLVDHEAQREKLGGGYIGSRRYVLENLRLNKKAEMVVTVRCDRNGRKRFDVKSEQGWNSANKHVLQKMLESEEETSRPEKRPVTRISPDNYAFDLLGRESLDGRPAYVLRVSPKREDKYLFEGLIWVDAEDFALVRVEGQPAKNPSFWTHNVHFVARYQKAGDFWFPVSTESVAEARIFGETNVRIEYFDYLPNSELSKCATVDPPEGSQVFVPNSNTAVNATVSRQLPKTLCPAP
jgi:hypothetical protein